MDSQYRLCELLRCYNSWNAKVLVIKTLMGDKKVSILFKPWVRKLDADYTAGCERIFLRDALDLARKGVLKKAYTAAKIKRQKGLSNSRLKHIPFPYGLLDFIENKIPQKRPKIAKVVRTVYFLIQYFLYAYYCLYFIIKEFRTSSFYVFEMPLVACLLPKKTVVAYHNYIRNECLLDKFPGVDKIRFVFVSHSLMNQMTKRYRRINKERCMVLHNSVDDRFMTSSKRYKKPSKITFIFASTWVSVKGPEILCDLIDRVNKKYADKVIFRICGSTDLWSLSPARYKEYAAIDEKLRRVDERHTNVELLEATEYEKMPGLYKSATYCLFPSTWKEPFSNVILESMSSGTPVIAFRTGGNMEIISSGVNGYLVYPIGSVSFCNFVNALIKNFNRRKYLKMTEAALSKAHSFKSKTRLNELQTILGV